MLILNWKEFRFWYGENKDIKYHYKLRKIVLDILEKYEISDPLILGEPNFVLVRIEIDGKIAEKIKDEFTEALILLEGAFSKTSLESWDAEEDARNRILSTAKKLKFKLDDGKGWSIIGKDPVNNYWIPIEDNPEIKTKEFAIFMTKVVGKFTKAFIKEMPRRIDDRWLLSVMIHLLLNSITIHLQQEREIREFPIV